MCVLKPRRLSSRITCPSSLRASSIARCSDRLTAPRLARLWNSVRRSIVATAGSGRSLDAAGHVDEAEGFIDQFLDLRFADLTCWPDASFPATAWRCRGPAARFPSRPAAGRRRGRDSAGVSPCLNEPSCSSSITIRPSCGVGAKTALRAPTTTCTSPRAICCQCQCRSASDRCECSTATLAEPRLEPRAAFAA